MTDQNDHHVMFGAFRWLSAQMDDRGVARILLFNVPVVMWLVLLPLLA